MPSNTKLDPTVKPFPAYIPTPIAPPHSSPTATSYSSSSGFPESKYKSSNATSSSPPDRELTTGFAHAVLLPPPTSVKSFGHGWNSSHAAPTIRNAQSVSVLDTPSLIVPSRARSPSVPILPSHASLAAPAPAAAPKVASSGNTPFPTFTPRRIPSNYQLNHQPLAHHSSVPSLISEHDYDDTGRFTPTIGRGRSVSQWRQGVTSGLSDHAEEEGSEQDHAYSPKNPLITHRSVPALTAAPSGLTLTHDYTQSRNIYIPSLPAHWREADLRKLGEPFGSIMSIKLDVSHGNPPAGSRAFVMFYKVEAAHEFYKYLKRRGYPCEIAKEDYTTVHKSYEDPTSSNLYIQGFLPEDDMDFCREVLHPGRIISYSRPTDAQGRPRGILMARLESRPQAEEAIQRLNDRFVHPVTGNKLQVRIADSEVRQLSVSIFRLGFQLIGQRQKQYKRENDLNRSDKFSSMPNMRHASAPKMLTITYPDEREYRPQQHHQMSRETSYASLRSPTSGHFNYPDPGYANRHRPSNMSTSGVGGVWTSRNGWTSGATSSSGTDAGGNGLKEVACLWPEMDESSVTF